MDYKCTYASGSAMESFEINFKGDRPQIDGYRLDSPQLDKKEQQRGTTCSRFQSRLGRNRQDPLC